MCGRYVSVSTVQTIEKRFGVTAPEPEKFIPNTNVSPGTYAPVISSSSPSELHFFKFGFTPSWAKKQMYVINARAEGDHNKDNHPEYNGARGIINKPMFRKAIRSQRCLVIADAFIEGPEKEKLSKPYVVYLKNKVRPFAMAGIWDSWEDSSSGEIVHSFAIITTTANEVLQAIGHHRSPVILPPEHEADWINPRHSLAEVTALLNPFDAALMNAYPVDPMIKNPKLNGLSLLEPIGERIFPEFDENINEKTKLTGMGRRKRSS